MTFVQSLTNMRITHNPDSSLLLLPGHITETKTTKHVRLERNNGDSSTMERLEQAIKKLNAMDIKALADKRMIFALT